MLYDNNIFKVGYLMSACWVMRTELIDKIGLLDENIFYAPEDVEFCLRAWVNGYNVLYDKMQKLFMNGKEYQGKKY